MKSLAVKPAKRNGKTWCPSGPDALVNTCLLCWLEAWIRLENNRRSVDGIIKTMGHETTRTVISIGRRSWWGLKQLVFWDLNWSFTRDWWKYASLYLSALLCTCQTPRTLWSSNEILKLFNLKSVGEYSFSFIAPSIWNSLPASPRNFPTLGLPYLQSFLFQQTFPHTYVDRVCIGGLCCVGLPWCINAMCACALSFCSTKRFVLCVYY